LKLSTTIFCETDEKFNSFRINSEYWDVLTRTISDRSILCDTSYNVAITDFCILSRIVYFNRCDLFSYLEWGGKYKGSTSTSARKSSPFIVDEFETQNSQQNTTFHFAISLTILIFAIISFAIISYCWCNE